MSEPSLQRIVEYLRVIFQVMWQKPDGLPAREVLQAIPARLRLSESELRPASSGLPQYEKSAREASNTLAEVGWLVKTRERWYLSDEGLSVFRNLRNVEDIYRAALEKAAQGQQARSDQLLSIEQSEERAWEQIWKYLNDMNPVEFKYLVADLFLGLGYHIVWAAPPGKHHGYIDLVAQPLPLASGGPRVKVHVQHRGQPATMEGMRTFMGELTPHDLGVFVSSGGFTEQVLLAERSQELRRIRLVALEDFFEYWVQTYDQLSEQARQRFPLRAIYFLAPHK
jgi:restriction system protein